MSSPPATSTLGAGRYRLTCELGRGGMGQVVRVWDQTLGRYAALKIVHRDLHHPTLLARFQREAMLMARLHHPHLVAVYDLQLEEEPHYLVMEEVRGRDLEEILAQQGPLGEERICRIAGEVGSALDCLHRNAVLHRDLKPGNIMLRDPGESAVLMDLGLARVLDATALTEEGALLGTPRFLPPEVIRGEGWEAASDQWQLAATLFRLATGLHLNAGENIQEIMVRSEAGAWSEFPADSLLRPGFREALRKAVDPDPRRRFPNCEAFARALESGVVAAAQPPAPGPVDLSRNSVPAPGPGRRALWLRLLAVLILLVGAGGWWLRRAPREPEEVRWTVVGDLLEVRFRGASGVRLVVGGLELKPTCDASSRECRGEYRGLSADREEEVRLRWPGGERVLARVHGAPPAISPDPSLGPEGSLVFRVARRCRVWSPGDREHPRELAPGSHRLSLPRPLPDPVVLDWEEEGIRFRRRIARDSILEQGLRHGVEETAWEEVESWREGVLDRDPGTQESLRRLQRIWSSQSEWLPALLEGPFPPGLRLRLLRNWQAWGQLAELRTTMLGEQVLGEQLPQGVSPGASGDHGIGAPPLPAGVGLRPLSLPGLPAVLRLEGTFEWGQALEQKVGLPEWEFAWPVVRPAPRLILALHVFGLRPTVKLVVEEVGDGDFHLEFWHPRPRPSFKDSFGGLLYLVVPGTVLPTPGARLRIRCEPLLREIGGWVEIRGIQVLELGHK